jgi:CheY-like chemotaxis protein
MTLPMPSKTILLVEDDEDDAFIFRRALKESRIANPLSIAVNGKQAVDYLAGNGEYSDRERFPLPFIIFLDLKLPYLGGFDVLRWIRRQPELEPVVVVVLTSSDEERDHTTAYELGARSYIVKPPDREQLLNLFRSLESYWARFDPAGPVLRSATLSE